MRAITLAALAVACATTCSTAMHTDRAVFLAQSGAFIEHTSFATDFSISPELGTSTIIDIGTFTDKFDPNDYVIASGIENFTFGMDIYEPRLRLNSMNATFPSAWTQPSS